MRNDEADLLIQRFLDGELSRAETRTLIRLVAEQPEVRRRLLAGEALLEAAARLPRASPPKGFQTRVVERLAAEGVGAPRGRRGLVSSPLRWVPAAAAVLLLAAGFWLGRAHGIRTPSARPSAPPERQVFVRLVLIEPRARTVTVVGDFNGWDARRTPLERAPGGVWKITLPVKPGRYHYMYVVDGREWVADPLATETSLDGFGGQNSVLDVMI
jgi:anti-sigma factor RsiW